MEISKLNKILCEINKEKNYSIDESPYAHNLVDLKEGLSKQYVVDLFRRYALDKDCKKVELSDKDGLRSYSLETNAGLKIKVSVFENNFESVKDEMFMLESSLNMAKKRIEERINRINEIKKRVAGTLIVLAGAAVLIGGTKAVLTHESPVKEPTTTTYEDVHEESLNYSEQKRIEENEKAIEQANLLKQSMDDYSNKQSLEQQEYLDELRDQGVKTIK